MAEKVEKLGLRREKDFMYYVKDSSVWRVQRKQPHVPKGKPEKVAPGSFKMDSEFIYFVDRDGDVARATRAVGGQKRKKTVVQPPGMMTRKGSTKSPAKKGAAAKARPSMSSKKASVKKAALKKPSTRASKGNVKASMKSKASKLGKTKGRK